MIWLAIGVVLALLVAALVCRFAYGLVRQFGTILLRVEQIEGRIEKGGMSSVYATDSMVDPPHVIRSPPGAVYMRESDESMPTLLYICPVIPSTTGSGQAMRAGMVIRALAQRYRIWLLATPISADVHPLPLMFADLCEEWAIVPLEPVERQILVQPWEPLSHPPGRGTPVYWNMAFDVVHVFRLYSMPVARFYLPAGATRQLDLDDIESKAHQRHADLHRSQGEEERADVEEMQAEHYRILEDESFSFMDRIFVCSEQDRQELAERTAVPICVLPNAVAIPRVQVPRRQKGPFCFLFVGSLEYFPNQEAVIFFSTEIMALIRQRTAREFTFMIVGSGAESVEQTVADLPGVDFVGWVSDVAPYYVTADAAVAPIRSGGGTRVKVLEAFSYRLPVIATSLGVEGIAVRDGKEVLIADTAAAFADQCVRLIEDNGLAHRLTDTAFTLLQEHYTLEAITRDLSTCLGPAPNELQREDAAPGFTPLPHR